MLQAVRDHVQAIFQMSLKDVMVVILDTNPVSWRSHIMAEGRQLEPIAETPMQTTDSLGEFSRSDVLEELNRILCSSFFKKSARLCCFLRTSVSYMLEGKAELFKEYVVGTEVYKRPASYDPTEDSIVRTEARRLRSKLKEYYLNSPAYSPIMIVLTAGSYIPAIELRQNHNAALRRESNSYPHSGSRSDALSVAVFPFSMRSADSLPINIACDLEDELTHKLWEQPGIDVFRNLPGIAPDPTEQLGNWTRAGVEFIIQGYVTQASGSVIARLQLINLTGRLVWSGRFGCDSSLRPYTDISASVVSAIFASRASQDGHYCRR
jgi:TolB-like protein